MRLCLHRRISHTCLVPGGHRTLDGIMCGFENGGGKRGEMIRIQYDSRSVGYSHVTVLEKVPQ